MTRNLSKPGLLLADPRALLILAEGQRGRDRAHVWQPHLRSRTGACGSDLGKDTFAGEEMVPECHAAAVFLSPWRLVDRLQTASESASVYSLPLTLELHPLLPQLLLGLAASEAA